MSSVLLGILGFEDVDDSDVDVPEHLLLHHPMAGSHNVLDVLSRVVLEKLENVLGHLLAEYSVEVLVF